MRLQPKTHLVRLHGLLDHIQHGCGQAFDVRLVLRGKGKLRQCLLSIVLLPEKPAVDESLDAVTQRIDQGSDRQGGEDGDDRGLTTEDRYRKGLQQGDDAEIKQGEGGG